MLFDLQKQRRDTLARVRDAIEENETVLRAISPESPSRYLVERLIRRLKNQREKLEAGLIHDRSPG